MKIQLPAKNKWKKALYIWAAHTWIKKLKIHRLAIPNWLIGPSREDKLREHSIIIALEMNSSLQANQCLRAYNINICWRRSYFMKMWLDARVKIITIPRWCLPVEAALKEKYSRKACPHQYWIEQIQWHKQMVSFSCITYLFV